MPDPSAFLGSFLILALVVVMLWFALGTQRNIRRGNDLLRWAQSGLPLVGKKATMRWLGSSVAEVRLVDPVAPFRDASFLCVLEPRDIGWLWAMARAGGRRDFLIFRATLRRAPTFEFDATDSTGWAGPGGLGRRDAEALEGSSEAGWGLEQVNVRHSARADVDAMRRAWDRLGSASGGVWRLSVSQLVPHLEVHLLPPADPTTTSADRLFRNLLELAREVSPRG